MLGSRWEELYISWRPWSGTWALLDPYILLPVKAGFVEELEIYKSYYLVYCKPKVPLKEQCVQLYR